MSAEGDADGAHGGEARTLLQNTQSSHEATSDSLNLRKKLDNHPNHEFLHSNDFGMSTPSLNVHSVFLPQPADSTSSIYQTVSSFEENLDGFVFENNQIITNKFDQSFIDPRLPKCDFSHNNINDESRLPLNQQHHRPIPPPTKTTVPFEYCPKIRYTCFTTGRHIDGAADPKLLQAPSLESLIFQLGRLSVAASPTSALKDEIPDATKTLEVSSSQEFSWIDISIPNKEDLSNIATMHAIHPLTIEDIETRDEREKCEVFSDYVFICLRTVDRRLLESGPGNLYHFNHPESNNRGGDHSKGTMAMTPVPSNITTNFINRRRRQSIAGKITDLNATHDPEASKTLKSPSTLYIILFENLIITIHHEPIPHIRRVLGRLFTDKKRATADWIAYSLLDEFVDEFQVPIAEMQLEVDAIDEMVLYLTHRELSNMLRRIGKGRRRTTTLVRLLRPKTLILRVLSGSRCAPRLLRPPTHVYLRDVNDHVQGSLAALEEYAETLNRSHANYLAQISIELGEASNRLNIVMKKISAVAALFLPVSIVAGLWGMNVPVPGQSGIQSSLDLVPFISIIGVMVALVIGLYLLGRRLRWW